MGAADLNLGMPHALWIPGTAHAVHPLVIVEQQMTTANVRDAKTTESLMTITPIIMINVLYLRLKDTIKTIS